MYTFYFLHFLISGRLHQKIIHWYLVVSEVGLVVSEVGGRAGSNISIAIVHYRTTNEGYILQVSALNMLKRYISVRGAFDIHNRNLVGCGGLC